MGSGKHPVREIRNIFNCVIPERLARWLAVDVVGGFVAVAVGGGQVVSFTALGILRIFDLEIAQNEILTR